MKIYIPNSDNPKTGKGFFCQRLAKSMSGMGVEIVKDTTPHDVSLHIVKLAKTASRKKVVRLDGIYHDTGLDYKARNKGIKKNLHRADGAIYQSKFSKTLCDKYLGKFKGPTAVIHNGADINFYKAISPVDKKCKHLFYTSSRWRPHKRLKDIIHSFLMADIEDSMLYVAGNLKKAKISPSHSMFSDKRVQYIGVVNQKQAASYLKAADAFIHLCWFDSCPNGAVEAIASGTPVITNNVGGTHEVVAPSGGIVCKIDRPYDLSPVRLYKPPKIDRSIVADAMVRCSKEKLEIVSTHVEIDKVARKYLDFFKQVR